MLITYLGKCKTKKNADLPFVMKKIRIFKI